ncbi:MAG: hypothetical protein EPO32_01500 [Anaerolineae bacterium]|nr:MAG: hypothetical protein EPO32_01500 [Anaerolineae bacterium]
MEKSDAAGLADLLISLREEETPVITEGLDQLQFSLSGFPKKSTIPNLFARVSPFQDLIRFTVSVDIQDLTFEVAISDDGEITLTKEVEIREGDSPPTLDQEFDKLFSHFSDELRAYSLQEPLRIQDVFETIYQLGSAGASTDIRIELFVEKNKIAQIFAHNPAVKVILFFFYEHLMKYFNAKNDLQRLLTFSNAHLPVNEIVVLLGDKGGVHCGTNILIVGKDNWVRFNEIGVPEKRLTPSALIEIRKFYETESTSEFSPGFLIPELFYIETISEDIDDLLAILRILCELLSVVYLASATRQSNNHLSCEFHGVGKGTIILDEFPLELGEASIYEAYRWGFENYSADKIYILRQIISLEVTNKPEYTTTELLQNATRILQIAKSNFQVYIRKNVDRYFDKRGEMVELVQNFSENVNQTINKVVSEVTSNVYRTAGILIGVVIGGIIDKSVIDVLVGIALKLYAYYLIVFMILYWLSMEYFYYFRINQSYVQQKERIRDVISEGEITRLEGDSYKNTRIYFLSSYIFANLIFAVMIALLLSIANAF